MFGYLLSAPPWLSSLYCICSKIYGLTLQIMTAHRTIFLKVANSQLTRGEQDKRVILILADLFLSTPFIPRRKLLSWIHRPGYGTRQAIILKWIFVGSLLTLAYKSMLLSSLIPIRYETTIDTLEDMDDSGLPILIMKNTAVHKLIASDPRDAMKQVYKRSILYPVSPTEPRGVPGWVMEM